MNFNKTEKHRDQKHGARALSDCLPRCLDWRLLLFMTPILRATERIRDTVRQMSALALCSRHECCWLPHQRRGRGRGKKRERNGVSAEEKMEGTEEGKQRVEEDNRKEAGVRPHLAQASSVGQDLLCHVSVRQQPVWSESDTTSLDTLQAATLTPTDPREEQETSCALYPH